MQDQSNPKEPEYNPAKLKWHKRGYPSGDVTISVWYDGKYCGCAKQESSRAYRFAVQMERDGQPILQAFGGGEVDDGVAAEAVARQWVLMSPWTS